MSADEDERMRAVYDEAVRLLIKVEQYRKRGWSHIKVGSFDRLRAAVEDTRPTTAQRFDALAVDLPCAGDAA